MKKFLLVILFGSLVGCDSTFDYELVLQEVLIPKADIQTEIIEVQESQINESYLILFPAMSRHEFLNSDDSPLIDNAAIIFDENDNTIGYAYHVKSENGHGSIELMIGLDINGVVVDYLEVNFNQTPGISLPARKSNFGSTFVSKPIIRNYLDIDVQNGATVTSRTILELFEAASSFHTNKS